jgi:thioesterase domain-containing protein/acyl carrier protein
MVQNPGVKHANHEPHEIKEALLKIWIEVFRKKNINFSDNFFELGGDSKIAAKLMSKIEKDFQVKLPVSLLFRAPSIEEFSSFILNKPTLERASVITVQPKGNNTPLFLVGDEREDLRYLKLVKYLGEDRPIYEFKIPGEKQYIPKKNFKKIAAFFVEKLVVIQPDGPYFLGGSCIRGLIAYEMAQQLFQKVTKLDCSHYSKLIHQRQAWQYPSGDYWKRKTELLKKDFRSSSYKRKFKIVSRKVKSLFDITFSIISRNIFKIRYDYKPYPHKITLFKASHRLLKSYTDDPFLGWRKYCTEEKIELIEVPGKHATILDEPGVKVLADQLRDRLNKNDNQKWCKN